MAVAGMSSDGRSRTSVDEPPDTVVCQLSDVSPRRHSSTVDGIGMQTLTLPIV